MLVDVTITATLRPEVLYETLYSFHHNLFNGHDCKAIVNIDPVGHEQYSPDCIVKIIREFFFEYEINTSMSASFPRAFIWCWQQVDRDWVFHLEDDWRLERKVELSQLMRVMLDYPNLAQLRLAQFRSTEDSMKCWNLHFPWNGAYFACPDENKVGGGFCGHPSLIRSSFLQSCLPLLDPSLNPEKQFHFNNERLVDKMVSWDYGVYGFPNQEPYITDIGREWMVRNKLRKKGNKAWFQEWEKEE